MNYEAQCEEDQRQLLQLQYQASDLLDEYYDNQYQQKNLRRDMKTRRYKHELEQIIQQETFERLKFEKQIDQHVKMFSKILPSDEFLHAINKYVDKQDTWKKKKQRFLKRYETVTSLHMIQKNFYYVESTQLSRCHQLKISHDASMNQMHMDNQTNLNQSYCHRAVMKLLKKQNIETSCLVAFHHQESILSLKQLTQEEKLSTVISKIQVMNQLDPFDTDISMSEDGYESLHCLIPSIPQLYYNLSFEDQFNNLDKIYQQFYFIQAQLIALNPKLEKFDLEMIEYFKDKGVFWVHRRENSVERVPRILF